MAKFITLTGFSQLGIRIFEEKSLLALWTNNKNGSFSLFSFNLAIIYIQRYLVDVNVVSHITFKSAMRAF